MGPTGHPNSRKTGGPETEAPPPPPCEIAAAAIRAIAPPGLPVLPFPREEGPALPTTAVLAYVRVSTDDQAAAASPEAQASAILSTVAQGRLPAPAALVVEVGSGSDVHRPGLAAILEARPVAILVARHDRLSRDLCQALMILEDLRARGARLRSAALDVDETQPVGRLIIVQVLAIAEFELALIAERTSAGMLAKGGKSNTPAALRAHICTLRGRGYSWARIVDEIERRWQRKLARSSVRHIYLVETREAKRRKPRGNA